MPAKQSVSSLGLEDTQGSRPKLILQITVDQLRGDLPTRYYSRLGAGGFRYLWENGVVYRNAHHAHANTETIVGHATLATGAHPSGHGMVGNLWFDRETGFTTYNVEDANYRLLTEGADVDKDAEWSQLYEQLRGWALHSSAEPSSGPRPIGFGVIVRSGIYAWFETCSWWTPLIEKAKRSCYLPATLAPSVQVQLAMVLASTLLSKSNQAQGVTR